MSILSYETQYVELEIYLKKYIKNEPFNKKSTLLLTVTWGFERSFLFYISFLCLNLILVNSSYFSLFNFHTV